MEGYESISDSGDGWKPSKREIRRQCEAEDIRRHVREVAAKGPPMSDETRARVVALLSRPTPKHELMRWRLRLFCGHVVTRTAHYTHTTVHGAFTGSTRCTECDLDPATIVAGESVGLVEERPGVKPVARATDERTRVEKATRRHERELARLRAELDGVNAPCRLIRRHERGPATSVSLDVYARAAIIYLHAVKEGDRSIAAGIDRHRSGAKDGDDQEEAADHE